MACNGWTNYETWSVNIWTDGDERLEELAREAWEEAESTGSATRERVAKRILADSLRDYVESEYLEEQPESGLMADLLTAAFSEVNWPELADHLVDDNVGQWMEEEEEEEGEEGFPFKTDEESGRIIAPDFFEAKEILLSMVSPYVANGGWGWVEDVDGERFYVGRENMG